MQQSPKTPDYRLIRKEGEKWITIGAGWNKDNGGINMSIELVRGGEKIKCLLVKNEPKSSAERQPSVDTSTMPKALSEEEWQALHGAANTGPTGPKSIEDEF